jgi:hypothetical protein
MSINKLRDLSNSGELLIDLGNQPISNRFLDSAESADAPAFPLQLRIRNDNGLIHIGQPFPVSELKPRHDWLTCFEPEEHLDDMVNKIIALPGIHKASVFGAYSFKDDTTLRRLEKLGYTNTWRLDPVVDLEVEDPCANVETYQDVLNEAKAKKIAISKGLSDVLIVRHVIEHSNDLPEFINSMKALTNPDGYIIWELPDCERAFENGDCTTIWEEHTYYFTRFTFRQLLIDSDFEIVHFESVPYPFENSIVAIVKLENSNKKYSMPDLAVVQQQITMAQGFVDLIKLRKIQVREKLIYLKDKYGQIAMFGAGHLSVAFLSIMGVSDLIEFVIDDNSNKKGMLMPVGRLPILGSEALYSKSIGVCLLSLNPQNQPKVILKHQQFIEQGGIFASIFPGGEFDLITIL